MRMAHLSFLDQHGRGSPVLIDLDRWWGDGTGWAGWDRAFTERVLQRASLLVHIQERKGQFQ